MTEFDYGKYVGGSGGYVTFSEVGDTVIGTIKLIREGTDFSGNVCPELLLEVSDEGEEKTLTAGQVMLKAALAEKRPQVGDRIKVTYSGTGDGRPGRQPPKLFTVDVKPGPHQLVNAAVADDDAPF